ncbi:MAG: hypothetical protein LBK58_13635, partial [Prevotellaceae bacterium]|nr:hypothetical protein [Prevotellaceae bacterium]
FLLFLNIFYRHACVGCIEYDLSECKFYAFISAFVSADFNTSLFTKFYASLFAMTLLLYVSIYFLHKPDFI